MTENRSLEQRVAQLEQVVATQSEMILKLVEMMNHLGQESVATNERLNAATAAAAEQFAKVSQLLQKLAGQLEGDVPPSAN